MKIAEWLKLPLRIVWQFREAPKKPLFWFFLLSASVYFLQGIEGLPSLAVQLWMKEKLHMPDYAVQSLLSWTLLAWLIKPTYGILIDSFFSKKTWIYISVFGGIGICTLLGFWSWPSLAMLIILMALLNWTTAIRDVSNDGIACVVGKSEEVTGKFQCFDSDTEILTKCGWKKYNEITIDDSVLSLDIKSGKGVYSKIKNIFINDYSGKMYSFASSRFKFLFTPNHRFLFKLDDKRSKKWYVKSIKDLFAKQLSHSILIKNNFVWDGVKPNSITFTLKDKQGKIRTLNITAEKWYEFLGWFISEGSLYKRKKDWQIGISQLDKENRRRIETLLLGMGLNFNKSGPREFLFWAKEIYEHLAVNCYTNRPFNCYSKKVPQYIKDASPDYIRIFLNAYNLGDGWKRTSEIGYCTTSKQLSDDIQELILKSGRGASVKCIKRNLPWHDLYVVHEKFRTHASFSVKNHLHKINYSGIVWDVEVDHPDHIILIRREGKAIFTGNSVQWASITVASIFAMLGGGWIVDHSTFRIGYIALIPLLIPFLLLLRKVPKTEDVISCKRPKLGDYKKLLNKDFLMVCLFLWVYKTAPSFAVALTYLKRDAFHWTGMQIAYLDAFVCVVELVGAWAYFKWCKVLPIRKMLVFSIFLGVPTTLCYLYYTPVTAWIYSALFGSIGMMIFLISLDFCARKTLAGLESTSFATLMSISNFASWCSLQLGSFTLRWWGYNTTVVLSSFVGLAALLLVRYINWEDNR